VRLLIGLGFPPDFSSLLVGKALLVQDSSCDLAPLRDLPHLTSRRIDPLSRRRALLSGCRPDTGWSSSFHAIRLL